MISSVGLKYSLLALAVLVIALGAFYLTSTAELSGGKEFGSFDSNPIFESLPDKHLLLIQPVKYTDPNGRVWAVPAPFKTDCASIPSLFKVVVGGPCEFAYRDAATVHDYYCLNFDTYWHDEYKRDWKEVHRAFYYAMRARGVKEVKAKMMYAAVYYFGPRWQWDGDRVREIRIERFVGMDILPEDDIHAFVKTKNPSLEEIEEYVPMDHAARYIPKEWAPAKRKKR